ncbi:MAG TPA: alpha/beta hydrolase [Gaiellaceae bacterium]|nr:alpha/beta hydrolase [Gaiellaceae bacterium]
MRVSVGDVDLYVHQAGEGRPLILLHGGPGLDGSTWFPGIVPLAAEGWRILAPDLRGNGRSDAGYPARWTVPQMADDVEALIRVLGLERPVVIGQSFGSFVAQSHMVRHGSGDGYVLMGTVAEPRALEGIDAELERFQPVSLRAQVTASWMCEASVQTAEEARQLWHDQIPFHVADPEGPLVTWLIENDQVVFRPEVLRHFASGRDYGMLDLRAELGSFDKPVLVVSGEHDRTTSPTSAHELARLLPHGEDVTIRNAAHLMLYEQPEATLSAIRGFLRRV